MLPNNETPTHTKPTRLIFCAVGTESYGLDMTWVRSIKRSDLMQPRKKPGALFPYDPAPLGWLPGKRGASTEQIPVYSLLQILEAPDVHGPRGTFQRIVVIKGDEPWGLLVDRVSQATLINEAQRAPLPPPLINPLAPYFSGIVLQRERVHLLLAPENLNPATVAAYYAGDTPGPSPMRQPSSITSGSPKLPSGIERSSPAYDGANGRERRQLIVFSVADPHVMEQPVSLGLSVKQIPEILNPPPITPVPGSPRFILGVIHWRGRPVPVIDLARRLALTQGPGMAIDTRSRLVVARAAGGFIAFHIRPRVRVLHLPLPNQPAPTSLSLDPTLVRGTFDVSSEAAGETLVIPALAPMVT
jgi:chemotaxis signal transduction protein